MRKRSSTTTSRLGEAGLGVAVAARVLDQQVRPQLGVQDRRVLGQRLLHVGEVRQRLVVDVQRGHGVLGDGAAGRADRDDGLALVEGDLARQRVGHDPRRLGDRAQDRDRPGAAEHVVGEQHLEHALDRPGLAGVDGDNPSVRVGAAREGDVGDPRRVEVVHVATQAADQPLVLDALHALADPAGGDLGLGDGDDVSHRRPGRSRRRSGCSGSRCTGTGRRRAPP